MRKDEITVYLQQIPEHYIADYPSATIRYKKGEQDEALRLKRYIEEWRDQELPAKPWRPWRS